MTPLKLLCGHKFPELCFARKLATQLTGISMTKNKRYLESGLAFWIGIGLMSIINIIKINYTQHAVPYDWIMFGIAAAFIIICAILIRIKK
jgi:hypothetical protein